MRFKSADLLQDVVGTYDQTKTTIQGRVTQKTADGEICLGPPLNKFVDVQTDAAITLAANNTYLTDSGRMFVLGAEAGALTPLILYTVNYDTGDYSYVGRININLPDVAATTTVYRSIKVVDTGTSGWKVFIVTTGSVAINGGLLVVNNLSLADFVPAGYPTIPFATGTDQKAVYFLQDPANLGSLHINSNIASAGAVLDKVSNKIYVHNGISTVHQYYSFNTAVSLTWSASSATGVASTDVISNAGHSYLNGDQVVFTALSGGTGLVVGQTYFVISAVAGVSFQLSATSGGAAINFTTDITSAQIGRAFGITGSAFSHKTGNLPVLLGTLLLTDSEDFAIPGHTVNSGFSCAFFSTSTNLYLGKLSELTAGTTTWPSLITVNLLGTANQIVTSSATYAAWSNVLDRAVYSTGLVFVMKQFVNNSIDRIFGGTNNKYFEAIPNLEVVELQPAAAITTMDLEQGWLVVSNLTAGQRGYMLADLRSDSLFSYSKIITKVMDTPKSILKFVNTLDSLFDYTGSLTMSYRTSGFGSMSGGWVDVPFSQDLSTYATGSQIQFCIHFDTLALDTSIPAQLREVIFGYTDLESSSEYWELSVDDSDNGNPSRVAYRLKKQFPVSVPTLYFRAKDLSGVDLVNPAHNTSSDAARFSYSTNEGVSWSPLGTIPNTVGTLVRYTFSTAPGVDIRPSLGEV